MLGWWLQAGEPHETRRGQAAPSTRAQQGDIRARCQVLNLTFSTSQHLDYLQLEMRDSSFPIHERDDLERVVYYIPYLK